ncbi:hypothetical protein [Streptomyces tibetensis]|uniref:hypothetical protein n=1 Tax=Streptomyces tibetensis TaxID=2382123 RepID=UPI00340622FC
MTHDAEATAQQKSTAKWLVGACAAVAAVLVAGLQLGNLEKLGNADTSLGLLALGAAFLALASAVVLLYLAARVIGTTRPPADDLDLRDRADHGNYPQGPRLDPPTDPLLRELVVSRRTELLGPRRDAIGSLLDDLNQAESALATGAKVQISDRTYRPRLSSSDATALRDLVRDLEQRIRRLSDAAERFKTTQAYDQMRGWFPWLGVAFVVGVFGFAWLTLLYPQTLPHTAEVTNPVQIEVSVPPAPAATKAGWAKGCAGKTLSGVAVGGTLEEPTIVTRSQPGCPGRRTDKTEGLLVVPVQTAK